MANRQCVIRGITARPLSSLEEPALHQFMEEATDAAALLFGAGHHVIQGGAVAERHVAAGRVNGELLGEVEQERVRIGRQQRGRNRTT